MYQLQMDITMYNSIPHWYYEFILPVILICHNLVSIIHKIVSCLDMTAVQIVCFYLKITTSLHMTTTGKTSFTSSTIYITAEKVWRKSTLEFVTQKLIEANDPSSKHNPENDLYEVIYITTRFLIILKSNVINDLMIICLIFSNLRECDAQSFL